ncbi:BREX-1 system adenine-specific DNA-methyltransferase PglX [Candidatus Weimeria sp. HCP3S3_B5]|uniref:BREX-1 system adenine-specific DNA-methyltransferase PglX n=1 Tax=Candidatus Weimeria sp. HCP3S3_B5 TaxID=3438871 RepID=UPI003F8914EA
MGDGKKLNKSAIKNFAMYARETLMESARSKAANYGVRADGISDPVQKGPDFEIYDTEAGAENQIFGDDIKKRRNLVKAVKEKGYDAVIEETAYTWFNRLIAIRFMEVNGYLPSRTRVLSSDTGNTTPDIINDYMDIDLGMSDESLTEVAQDIRDNHYDAAFQTLFIAQCNKLNDILPGLFEKTDDYMELLLELPYTVDGVVKTLIGTVPEDDFNIEKEGQIEIIGWLYQYYNTQPKADAFAKKGKITKDEIPAVTQLFTPDWIVRYMVENSVGRIWIEHLRANDPTADEKEIAEHFGWKYYLPEVEQEPEVQAKLDAIYAERKDITPEDITAIDPCMGSGHILVYLFEVLMQIYREDGYTERDAASLIIEKNLYGLDIDDRAYQLSYFAVMMKARQYNPLILKMDPKPQPHVYSIQESNSINRDQLQFFGSTLSSDEKSTALSQMTALLGVFEDAKEYGSILQMPELDWNLLDRFVSSYDDSGQINMFTNMGLDEVQKKLTQLVNIGEILGSKYDVAVTNPPYMAGGSMDAELSKYVKKNYPDSKADLFAVFMERCSRFVKADGYQAMITMHSWMFLSSFEKLREKIQNVTIVNMAHLGARAFEEIGGEVVQTTSFVFRKTLMKEYKGTFCRLIEPKSQDGKEEMFLSEDNRFQVSQQNFDKIPSRPIAYWASNNILQDYSIGKRLDKIIDIRQGIKTADKDRFLRLWPEVEKNKITLSETGNKKWFPCNKGGSYRLWYGNNDYIVNWENDGYEIRNFKDEKGNLKSRPQNLQYMLRKGLTYSNISTTAFAVRYSPKGHIYDAAGSGMFSGNDDLLLYAFGFLVSKVAYEITKISSPTMSFEVGQLSTLPFIYNEHKKAIINDIVKINVNTSKSDWDSYETSWDFNGSPLIFDIEDSVPENFDAYGDSNDENTELSASDLEPQTSHLCTASYTLTPRPYTLISDCYAQWKHTCNSRFDALKANEEELNRIFIDIYGLQDELTPEESDKDVTVHRIYDTKEEVPESMQGSNYVRTKRDEIVSFISYAVGCMFGRYRLDKPGLAFAGGDWKEYLKENPYPNDTDTGVSDLEPQTTDLSQLTFLPDEDAIIPITDENYSFKDDIVARFRDFVRIVYGEDTLAENMEFIAEALGNKGTTSDDVIRNYFVNDFYKDHCNTYSVTGSGKRPIYWLFDSGKTNGFKALIYMHRYTPDTVGLVRSKYLHMVQGAIENAKQNAEYIISTSNSATEKAQATKKRDKYVKQLTEMRPYYQALSHIALQKLSIDLDDGVKHNYALFQGVEVSSEGKKPKKIDLLAKI